MFRFKPTELGRAMLMGVFVLSAIALSGCRSSNHLADYEYRGKTLAAEYDFPPYPEVFTGSYYAGNPKRPLLAAVRLGTRIVKEAQAESMREKLDSASQNVDVVGEITDRVLTRATRYLRTTAAANSESADFLFEVRVRSYGIDADDWDAAAQFFINAEVALLDGYSGREIWRTAVQGRDNISPSIFGSSSARNVVTAHAFSRMTVPEVETALDRLADFSADAITDQLSRALRKARK